MEGCASISAKEACHIVPVVPTAPLAAAMVISDMDADA